MKEKKSSFIEYFFKILFRYIEKSDHIEIKLRNLHFNIIHLLISNLKLI